MGKWIFNKHTKKMAALDAIIANIAVKRTSSEHVADNLIEKKLYNPRTTINATTINNKFKELQFYNLVYKSNGKYILSTLGNYYYKGLIDSNVEMRQDAFINTTFNVQYPHAYNKSASNLFPFRLIYKLMTEEKIERKLYNNEIFGLLYEFEFYNETNELEREKEYQNLLARIVDFRAKSHNDKLKHLNSLDKIADRIHQVDYYVMPIFNELSIINIDKITDEDIVKFTHPQKLGATRKPTSRKYIETSYSISKKKYDYIEELLLEMPAHASVYTKENMLDSDYKQVVFNAVSDAFLDKYIEDETTGTIKYIKQLSQDVIFHSNNAKKGSPEEFEEKLEDLFNMFEDVRAERISGPGKTDIECIYTTINLKFNIEAKSTTKKLLSINAGRLSQHMVLASSNYTLVVAPNFAPSAIQYDILNAPIVAVRASVLCEYIQNMVLNGNYSYAELNKMIIDSFGEDVTNKLQSEISVQFGVSQLSFI